jgi:hypothetical protein
LIAIAAQDFNRIGDRRLPWNEHQQGDDEDRQQQQHRQRRPPRQLREGQDLLEVQRDADEQQAEQRRRSAALGDKEIGPRVDRHPASPLGADRALSS